MGEIAEIIGGGTPKTDRVEYFGGNISWITPADLSGYTGKLISHGTRNITQSGLENSGARLLPAGTVLFSSRAPIGYVAVAANPVATSQGFKNFVLRNGIVPDYVYYYLQHAKKLAVELASGTTFLEISGKSAANIAIPVAPLNEQHKIVAEIEKQLTRLEVGEKALRQIRVNLKRYRTSLLKSASQGHLVSAEAALARQQNSVYEPAEVLLQRVLTERRSDWENNQLAKMEAEGRLPLDNGWRAKYQEPSTPDTSNLPQLPEGWIATSMEALSSAVRVICYGILMPKNNVADGVLYVKVKDIKEDKIDLAGLSRTTHEIAAEYSRASLKCEDLLLTIRGTYGRVAEVPQELEGGNITQDTARIDVSSLIDKRYIAVYLRSPDAQDYFKRVARGVAVKGVNIGDVRPMPVLLPPLAEQKRIVAEVDQRLSIIDKLDAAVNANLRRATHLRRSVLQQAFTGRLVPQDLKDEPAAILLQHLRTSSRATIVQPKRESRRPSKESRSDTVSNLPLGSDAFRAAFARIGHQANSQRLFNELGLGHEQVTQFYETLRTTPEVLSAFEEASGEKLDKPKIQALIDETTSQGRFRLADLWLEDFKNLKDYTVHFDPTHGLDVVLGWNGTGKSNLFEALVIIFRDLYQWREKNYWPKEPMNGYRISYVIDQQLVEVSWDPKHMKRPRVVGRNNSSKDDTPSNDDILPRTDILLPRFVFGYYSGPTNRMAEHFQPMKQAHYDRLRKATSDDPKTLALLLEQRHFFCAETHHAKYVLLAFCYKEDLEISRFLDERLRITGFESALFIIRKPRWAKKGATPQDFWGAEGVMRRVMERLRRFAIAPMVVRQPVSDGYRTTTEDHYYFFLPNLQRLHAFAAEYDDARTFFVALESTDFSELIHDVKIQVRVKANHAEQVPITFREMSEGEQQLLMVLGLMRFTKSNQSLVLLDEPDTHLNPHWSVDYLKLLTNSMSENTDEANEQQTSQILISTHDPLVIASLVKEQVHLLKRDVSTGICKWFPATINPRGLGFTGIITSEMFGFRSDLDEETLADLDSKVRLVAQENELTTNEAKELEEVNKRLEEAGFSKVSSDPYYAAFVRAWGRRYSDLMAGQQFVSFEKQQEIDRIAREVLEEAIAEVQQEIKN